MAALLHFFTREAAHLQVQEWALVGFVEPIHRYHRAELMASAIKIIKIIEIEVREGRGVGAPPSDDGFEAVTGRRTSFIAGVAPMAVSKPDRSPDEGSTADGG